jgi:type II secretory pathway predicted ATPase ExeA
MNDEIAALLSLKRCPFGKDLAVDALWLDPTRQTAIERLLDAVLGHRHCFVRGESGVGKNCVVRALTARLPETGFRLVYISNVTVGRRDFYRQLSLALGLDPRGTAAAVFEAVQREIRNGWREQRVHPVVVIDEAHLLNDATLSHLHILANFDLDSSPLLSLVLIGLPELHDRLKLGVNRSLLTRIGTMVDIAPTTPDQTAAYVRARLESAGARSELFASDAMTLLHELTAGVPRVVDTVALGSLELAAATGERLVTRATVRRAWQQSVFA